MQRIKMINLCMCKENHYIPIHVHILLHVPIASYTTTTQFLYLLWCLWQQGLFIYYVILINR